MILLQDFKWRELVAALAAGLVGVPIAFATSHAYGRVPAVMALAASFAVAYAVAYFAATLVLALLRRRNGT
jgi:MFS superfamily sulfate permease-like transporter